jgi:hypothetical protein
MDSYVCDAMFEMGKWFIANPTKPNGTPNGCFECKILFCGIEYMKNPWHPESTPREICKP